MDSPKPSTGGDSTRIAASRSSLVDSFKGCGLTGVRIDKEDLRRGILIPEYIRLAMRDAIRLKDPEAGFGHESDGISAAPEAPMVVFVNSKSGGRLGQILMGRLQELMGQEQVFDLSAVKPPEFVQYGLACLEKMASSGDYCAKEVREKLRVVVAGGDGTVGWVLGSLADLYKQNREPVPPTGIIPLGTGNDLSRSFGWGGSFPFAWSWHVAVSMPAGESVQLPYSLRLAEDEFPLDQLEARSKKQEAICSIPLTTQSTPPGMDAQVAYGFHQLRDEKPYLAQGPIANKVSLFVKEDFEEFGDVENNVSHGKIFRELKV
ncbi:hypothetical protein GIB67_021017 [Kingdonia uniflora]|uniref:DAGKc domain-containing protein n=1 Tax=Kingdonia uniflora TaxID=39325 RepID=A0A7J7N7I8_9MAGN|nr:hypothetical protein GIB67_021017 [Kingdonia uniflora]